MDPAQSAALSAKGRADTLAAMQLAKKRKVAELEKDFDDYRAARDPGIRKGALADVRQRASHRKPADEVFLSDPGSLSEGEVDSANASSTEEPLAGWGTRKHPAKSQQKATVSGNPGRPPVRQESPARKSSASNTFSDDRRQGMLSEKIRKRTSVASRPVTQAAASSSTAGRSSVVAGSSRSPPKWYLDLGSKTNKRDPILSQAEASLSRLKTKITACKDTGPNQALFDDIRMLLHEVAFHYVDGNLLRAKRILHNDDGLPQLFDASFSVGIVWPFDIKSDAEELYNKWSEQIFEVNLYRGIRQGATDIIDKLEASKYKLMDPKVHGNGKLLNGQWWPTQLCTVVAGAHGASIAGITGDAVNGAYSVVMSGGLDPSGVPYPNIDNGDTVQYCGTDAMKNDGQPSGETRQMIINSHNGQPVRLIRSSKLGGEHAPEKGYRYDGLYSVTTVEQMDPADSQRQRHRFTLVRVAGQDPIRSTEPERRPTQREIAAYTTDRTWRGKGK
ncbi:hypothetical protein B0A48_12355 [Cryoendolithus antarcticus]|uniref:YDG domain-containing protein n=1 Tax=Cryoendolithus antarcticus TaxID=1507870 RepID=A0A1V8SSK3_9PEZI|nr:hypothetical protein B0A48_12355 [Cryoendolithus antarcticus]